MPALDPIAALIARLEAAIVAPRRRRRELAREIEGDLREAVAARIAAGQPPRAAATAVAAEFGEPRAIAGELSTELLAHRGRRVASLGAIAIVTLLLAWTLGMTLLVGMGLRVPAEDEWMLRVSRSLDGAGPLVAGAAIAGAVVIRRSGSRVAIAAVAALQLCFAAALVAGAVAMVGAVAVPAAGVGALAALVALTLLLGSGLGASSAAVLLRCGIVRREPRPARA